MTQQLTLSEISLLGTKGSAFLPLAATSDALIGLVLTPTVIFNTSEVRLRDASRGLSSKDRAVRISANPKRAEGLIRGRQRLAAVLANQNDGRVSLAGLRLAAGLSQGQLGERLGTQQPNIARMERRPGDLAMSTLQNLAAAFGVDVGRVIEAATVANEVADSREQ